MSKRVLKYVKEHRENRGARIWDKPPEAAPVPTIPEALPWNAQTAGDAFNVSVFVAVMFEEVVIRIKTGGDKQALLLRNMIESQLKAGKVITFADRPKPKEPAV